MPRFLLAVAGLAVALAGCDAAPRPFAPSQCARADYADWQTSDYVLPYPPGEVYVVLQANCGPFSHTEGSPIVFAYDFRMPIGETVVAARGGAVTTVIDAFEDGDNVRGHENAVVVDHGDGSFGIYLHFTRGGIPVEVGDQVAQGDTLGLSGNTGFSTEPHLHFDVRANCSADFSFCDPVPVTFRNTAANPGGLVAGRPYLAAP